MSNLKSIENTVSIANATTENLAIENPVIEIVAEIDLDLITVTGGRSYGWGGGGWKNDDGRPSGFRTWSQGQPG